MKCSLHASFETWSPFPTYGSLRQKIAWAPSKQEVLDRLHDSGRSFKPGLRVTCSVSLIFKPNLPCTVLGAKMILLPYTAKSLQHCWQLNQLNSLRRFVRKKKGRILKLPILFPSCADSQSAKQRITDKNVLTTTSYDTTPKGICNADKRAMTQIDPKCLTFTYPRFIWV